MLQSALVPLESFLDLHRFFGHEYKRDVVDIAVSIRCKKRQLCVRNKSEVTGYYKCENAESGLLAEAAEHQAPCKRNRGLEV